MLAVCLPLICLASYGMHDACPLQCSLQLVLALQLWYQAQAREDAACYRMLGFFHESDCAMSLLVLIKSFAMYCPLLTEYLFILRWTFGLRLVVLKDSASHPLLLLLLLLLP